MARGLAPVGLRSSPKNQQHLIFSDTPHVQDSRLLRSRTGASPLATGILLTKVSPLTTIGFLLQ